MLVGVTVNHGRTSRMVGQLYPLKFVPNTAKKFGQKLERERESKNSFGQVNPLCPLNQDVPARYTLHAAPLYGGWVEQKTKEL